LTQVPYFVKILRQFTPLEIKFFITDGPPNWFNLNQNTVLALNTDL